MSELDEIYKRMLTFITDMGVKYPGLQPLTSQLTRAKTLDVFLRVFDNQREIRELVLSFDCIDESSSKTEANKLIDIMLKKYDLTRDMFSDSQADFDKLARYLILWADVIYKQESY